MAMRLRQNMPVEWAVLAHLPFLPWPVCISICLARGLDRCWRSWLAGCGEAGQRYRDGLSVLGDDGRLVPGEVGHEGAEGRGPVGAGWLGPDAVRRRAGQHAQEPAWLWFVCRDVEGGEYFPAAQAGAVPGGRPRRRRSGRGWCASPLGRWRRSRATRAGRPRTRRRRSGRPGRRSCRRTRPPRDARAGS